MTVRIYVDTSKRLATSIISRPLRLRKPPNGWFAEHDPEGVAFEYWVICTD